MHVWTRYEVSVIKGLSTDTSNAKRIHCTVNLKAHCACEKKCKMWKTLKNYYFENIVHSCIIFCVCIAPVEMHTWAKYEGSKLNHVARRATWRIELKCLPFKKYRLYSLIHVHILGAYVHIWSFCDQTCGQEDCPQMTTMTMTVMPVTTHNGQFMIV